MAREQGTTIPIPPAPNRSGRRTYGAFALVALLVAASLVGAWRLSASSTRAQLDQRQLNESLLAAIHDGDHQRAQRLLEEGAEANALDEGGDTPLMQAALNADLGMMRLLLDKHADVNARGRDGASPLLRAIHDPEKVRLLLSRGARVENRALVYAAWTAGSRKTLELLLHLGAQVDANLGGCTALMAACLSGDLDSVRCLVEHGADVQATIGTECTAVKAAVQSGNPAIGAVLLAKGAKADGRCQLPDAEGDMETPVMAAAILGHTECLRQLLDQGADVNVQGGPFDRTALIGAATTGNEEVVRLLLAHGADVQAGDWEADTALDWALRRGETSIVKLLRAAGAKPSPVPERSKERPRLHREIDSGSIRRAIAASLPPLQHSALKYREKRGCVTCHQHSLLAMTVGAVRRRGLAVNEEEAAENRADVTELLGGRIPLLLLGAGIDPLLAPLALVGLAAEDQKPSKLTDALVHYLVLRQRADGRWQSEAYRPPDDASDFMFTALAVRGLQCYTPPGRAAEVAQRIDRARDWLQGARPAETVDRVFQLLGLRWAGAAEQLVQAAAQALLWEQRSDGGWAQLPTLPSDAYATGQALFALHETGQVRVEDPIYQRGVQFLLRTQLQDGSWFVPTRSFPVVDYLNSGFPHGKAQFISASATCWATLALVQTLPPAGTEAE